ncbi:MAG: DUF29 domain-containing protein [Methylococcaceae bacterium]|nr:DUF29 domain-containing protein [Methylococcaceae bacterium]
MAASSLHDRDFYAWTQQQIRLLKSGELVDVDFEHLIEEIEGMGAIERRELTNRLAVLMAHLLKWQFQPSFRGRSWQLTIKEQRQQLQRHLRDNPSLQAKLSEFVADAYLDAILKAAKETGLEESTFPAHCPYPETELLNPEFYPGTP